MSEEYEWIQIGRLEDNKKEGRFYQKRELYQYYESDFYKDTTTTTHFSIQNCIIAVGRNGGPIAITRDPDKLIATAVIGVKEEGEQIISIYSCSGRRLSSFEWKNKGVLLDIGWDEKENLICVSDKGKVYVYNIFGYNKKYFTLKLDEDEKILRVKIFQGGIVVLTRDSNVWLVSRIGSDNPYYEKKDGKVEFDFDEIDEIKEDIKLEVIQRCDENGYIDMDIYVVIKNDRRVIHLSTDQPFSQKEFDYQFRDIALTPDGKRLCLFTKDNGLWVISSDYIETMSEPIYLKDITDPPTQIKWCGSECVCLYWEPKKFDKSGKSLLMMVGATDRKSFYYDGPIYIETEIDGLKIISNESYEFLHLVPKENKSIFKMGSQDAAATLYDSYLEFEEKIASSIKNIRNIEKKLKEAVEFCIKAAGNEFNPKQQTKLLKAASYGKSFITTPIDELQYNYHREFVKMCKILRVLNAVRDFTIGIPISFKQFEHLTIKNLIERLTNRNHHFLAYEICGNLGLNQQKKDVLIHWACSKVSSDEDDEKIINAIKAKCDQNVISYAKIAQAAFRTGKKHLATNLLDYEIYPGEKVHLLLEMEQEDDMKNALRRAIESGDAHLIYLVLLKLFEKLEQEEFIRTLFEEEFEVAKKLYLSFCKQQGGVTYMRFLRLCYDISDLPEEEGFLSVQESFDPDQNFERRIDKLRDAKDYFSKNTVYYEESKFCDIQIKLLDKQKKYDELFGKHIFSGLSVVDTISMVIEKNLQNEGLKRARILKKAFKVNDKHFYYIAINAFAKRGKWGELKEFSQSKRPPVGFDVFVDACKKYGNYKEAENYMKNMIKK